MRPTIEDMRQATLQYLRDSLVDDEAELESITRSLEAIKSATAAGGPPPVLRWDSRRPGEDREDDTATSTTPTAQSSTRRWIIFGLAVAGLSLLSLGLYSHFYKKK